MNSAPFIEYLSAYADFTAEEIDRINTRFKYRRYLKGQYVVQQGDVCRHESFVIRGCLRTYHVDENGHEHVFSFAIENWWAADLGSFLDQTPAEYNVQCLENTEVVQIASDHYEEMFREVPKMERVMRIVTQRGFISSWRRIVRDMSKPAKERYLEFKAQYPLIEQRVPQYMIASYLGITKEFLSKIRNQLIMDQ